VRTSPSIVSLFALLVFALGAPHAAADVAPPNLRGCEDRPAGAACLTDSCAPGTCRSAGLCKESDLVACVMCRRQDAGACEEACRSTLKPCIACAPSAPEDAAANTYRFEDCSRRQMGEPCKTPACGDGVCRCDGPSCAEVLCLPPLPPSRVPRVALLLAAAVALVLAVVVARRRRGKRRS
jgi:hypothetical protein